MNESTLQLHKLFPRIAKFRRMYWAVMDGASNYPSTLYRSKWLAKHALRELKESQKRYGFDKKPKDINRYYIKRFDVLLNGTSIDIFEHEYQRKEK